MRTYLLPGSDHLPWGSDGDAIVDDIVGATDKAAKLGDRGWRQ